MGHKYFSLFKPARISHFPLFFLFYKTIRFKQIFYARDACFYRMRQMVMNVHAPYYTLYMLLLLLQYCTILLYPFQ